MVFSSSCFSYNFLNPLDVGAAEVFQKMELIEYFSTYPLKESTGPRSPRRQTLRSPRSRCPTAHHPRPPQNHLLSNKDYQKIVIKRN